MRYSFRTLLILLAIGPPLVAGFWRRWQAANQEQRRTSVVRGLPPGAFLQPSPQRTAKQIGNEMYLGIEIQP